MEQSHMRFTRKENTNTNTNTKADTKKRDCVQSKQDEAAYCKERTQRWNLPTDSTTVTSPYLRNNYSDQVS